MDELSPDGHYHSGPNIRCVECKREWYAPPPIPLVAGELEEDARAVIEMCDNITRRGDDLIPGRARRGPGRWKRLLGSLTSRRAETISNEELEELERLLAAATTRPWVVMIDNGIKSAANNMAVCDFPGWKSDRANAALIVALVNVAAPLLAAVHTPDGGGGSDPVAELSASDASASSKEGRGYTEVAATMTAKHLDPIMDEGLHEHAWRVRVFYPAKPLRDGRALKAGLEQLLAHLPGPDGVLPEKLWSGEAIAESVCRLLTGCVGVRVCREEGYAAEFWL